MKDKTFKYILSVFLVFCFCNIRASIPGDSLKVRKERIFEVFNTYGLNSNYSEICPVFYNSELVFCSNREWNKNTLGESDWSETSHYNIFKSSITYNGIDSVNFDKIKVFSYFLMSHLNVGPITFNNDYSEAVYVENEYVSKKKRTDKYRHVQLYSVKIDDGKLREKEKLSFCESQYNYTCPTMSPDGKVLVFASNLPCKNKGVNLFVSKRTNGEWSDPIPLDSVNSDANESFTTIHNGKLYFSSDGYDSNGKLDLFVAETIDTLPENVINWGNVTNLGKVINSTEDDFGIVFNNDKNTGYFVSNRPDENDTTLSVLNDDIYSFEIIDKAIFDKDFSSISGKFEYYRLKGKPDNMKVMLLDEDGNVFAITTTDNNGHFNFNYLPSDRKYTIKVNDEGEVILTLFQNNDQSMLMANEHGEFVFRKLSYKNAGVLSLIDEGDVNLDLGTYDFKGQLEYQTILLDSNKLITVYLVDEEGNIFMQTQTDEFGNFIFENLPYGTNYIIKVDETEDLLLKVYNNVDHLMATMTKDNNGNFIYRLLDYDNTTNIQLLNEEESLLVFAKERMLVKGVFTHIDGINDKIAFEILDKEGNLLSIAETNSDGSFILDNLPLLEDLIFRIDESSPYFNLDLKINIVNRSNKILVTLDKDDFGMYEFKRMVSSKYTITETEELEKEEYVEEVKKKISIENHVIYYPSNVYEIDKSYYPVLDSMIKSLIDNPNAKIQIFSHASATSTAKYNMKLSQKRMNKVVSYFSENGIELLRMNYKAYGESKLLNRCGDDQECEEAMHQVNRRTELKIIQQNLD
ncbi:MAG: hypothetical protein CL846_05245 [Crocinitomicaceae bacterium]|nr:hypothetical protein [Crocinitomicaceae bacterium]